LGLSGAILLLVCGSGFTQDEIRRDVDLRILTWQPTRAERRIDDVAWAPDIRTALRLGKESGRPIFLFTHDGRMGVGRQ
jgi:hypothetical protein